MQEVADGEEEKIGNVLQWQPSLIPGPVYCLPFY